MKKMKFNLVPLLIIAVVIIVLYFKFMKPIDYFAMPSNTQEECSKKNTCKSCADTFGCGWCLSSKKCLARSNMSQCDNNKNYVEFENQCSNKPITVARRSRNR